MKKGVCVFFVCVLLSVNLRKLKIMIKKFKNRQLSKQGLLLCKKLSYHKQIVNLAFIYSFNELQNLCIWVEKKKTKAKEKVKK